MSTRTNANALTPSKFCYELDKATYTCEDYFFMNENKNMRACKSPTDTSNANCDNEDPVPCEFLPPGPPPSPIQPFVVETSDNCQVFLTERECRLKAEHLGWSLAVSSSSTEPPGCYSNPIVAGTYFYNTNMTSTASCAGSTYRFCLCGAGPPALPSPSSPPASPPPAEWVQIGSDINGQAAYDYSGHSISMSDDGTVIAIGSHGHAGPAGANAGQVRVFKRSGSPDGSGTWVQRGADLDGPQESAYFGRCVALNGDGTMMVVGIPSYDDSGLTDVGSVRIYVWNGNSWNIRGLPLIGEAANDGFGMSVDISNDGSIVVVGAYRNDGEAGYYNNAGHVRAYRWYGGSWTQRGADIDGERAMDYSGYDVSCNSDCSRIIIGAYGNDDEASGAGQARIYAYSNTQSRWDKLGGDIDGFAENDQSGRGVAMDASGNNVIIGAWGHDGPDGSGGTLTQSGVVRVMTWDSGSYSWVQKGNNIYGEAGANWNGWAVEINSDATVIIASATRNNDAATIAGHVRVFSWDAATSSWLQRGSSIEGVADSDYFGYSVAISADGNTIAGGSHYNDANGASSGHVRLYHYPV